MKTFIVTVALLTLCTAVQAQKVERFTGPQGEPCTRVTDANNNVVTQCGTGNSTTIGPAEGTGPMSAPPPGANVGVGAAPNAPTIPSPGAIGIPPEWSQPNVQPAPSPTINLVGRWTYQATEEGVPEEVLIVFQPNGQYNQFIRFPQTPALGNQIVQVWGQYVLQGTALSNTPAGVQVSNGPNPQQLCNLQTQRCITPNMQPSTVQLQPIDANTVQTPLGLVKRIAP